MPMWRCPHCGTPQAEASRCWVCRRSSTSCATCRHFRRAIAGQLGYCGLDRHRLPLRGDELRGCWEGAPEPSEPIRREPTASPSGFDRPRLDFVPLDPPTAKAATLEIPPPPIAPAPVGDPLAGFWADEA